MRKVLEEQLKNYRSKTYNELIQMIGSEPDTYELDSQNNKKYQIEIQAFWDDKPNGDIRVIGSIDDGGFSAFFPTTDDFIKNSNKELVGE